MRAVIQYCRRNATMSDLMMRGFTQARQPAGRSVLTHSVEALRIALRTYQTRQELPDLSARERADIGVSHATALAEAARLPWDTAPRPRRKNPEGVIGWLQRALERARTRRLLAQMQAREWADIGIDRSGADEEANKQMWRS
jgi:uncharacterized protein YjiS (DUF1127 family)